MITLKENKSNAPLFISFYNVVTKEKQNNIVKFDTVNELALGLVKEILTIDKKLSDVVVADLDFVLLANGDKKENLSTTQDFNHKMLLVPFSGWNINLSVVNRGRRTRLYFADKELMPDLADPDIDIYHVVKVPKNISKHVSKGKMVVSCSDEYGDCSPPSHFVSGEASVLNEKFGILVSLAATRLSSSFTLPQQAVTT